MPNKEQTFPILDFKGLGNPFIFTGNPQKVRSMTNVSSQFGRIKLRGGYTTLSAAQPDGILAFQDFKQHSNAVTLTMLDDTGEFWAFNAGTSTWTSRGSSDTPTGTFVDYTTHADNLYFIYQGSSHLQRWTGVGNISDVNGALTGRFVASFSGRLLVGYASGGSNTPQEIRYDAANNGATFPAGNILNLRETPGAIQKMLPLGKALYVYKTDGATIVRFVGSSTVTFSQERGPLPVGLLASGAIENIPGVGHIFLGTDGKLYVNDGSLVQPILNDLNNTIAQDINLSDAKNSYSALNLPDRVFSLFFPGAGDTSLTKRLDFNYQTGEFTVYDYSPGFERAYYSQYANNDLLNPSLTLVTSGTGADDDQPFKHETQIADNGVAISYEWRSDWFNMQNAGQKHLLKLDLICDNSSRGDIEVAVATDFNSTFQVVNRVTINVASSDPDSVTRINLGSKLGHYYNLRLRFFPRSTNDDIVLKGIMVYYTPLDSMVQPMRNDLKPSI